jgi:hypothetical protein
MVLMAPAADRLTTRDMNTNPYEATACPKMRTPERFRIGHLTLPRRQRADKRDRLDARRSRRADAHSPYQTHNHVKSLILRYII